MSLTSLFIEQLLSQVTNRYVPGQVVTCDIGDLLPVTVLRGLLLRHTDLNFLVEAATGRNRRYGLLFAVLCLFSFLRQPVTRADPVPHLLSLERRIAER